METKTFWTCANCNEQVEEHFAACWNCQYNREGDMAQGLSNSEEHRETPILTAKAPNRICLRCQTNLVYAGKKEFHEGMNWGVLGELGELLVNQTKLEMYYCPSCRHAEFFV